MQFRTESPLTQNRTMNTQVITITPILAASILQKANTENPRTIRRKVVSEYAADMKAGFWQTTHQGIAVTGPSINNPETLVDGQHRLAAIVQSKTTIRMLVTFNSPQYKKIDFGLKRQLSLVTGIDKQDLAVANTIISSITGNNAMPSQKQLLCEQFPRLGHLQGKVAHVSFITRAAIQAAFIVSEYDGTNEAELWYKQLVNNDVAMPTALRTLRSKLERDYKSLYGGMMKRSPAYAIALRAISAAKEGKNIDKLYVDSIYQNIEQYDGVVGRFVRENLI